MSIGLCAILRDTIFQIFSLSLFLFLVIWLSLIQLIDWHTNHLIRFFSLGAVGTRTFYVYYLVKMNKYTTIQTNPRISYHEKREKIEIQFKKYLALHFTQITYSNRCSFLFIKKHTQIECNHRKWLFVFLFHRKYEYIPCIFFSSW